MNASRLTATLLLAAITSFAQNSRYVTAISTTGPVSVTVLTGETAEIVSCHYDTVDGLILARPRITKDGVTVRGLPPGYPLSNGTVPRGTVVAGPAVILNDWASAILTVKITADTYDVNKTLILPPGTNQVYVTLESSTNLVNWADATNGVYGSPEVARFFRIRMDKRD
jgi:hypothetical protein